MMSNVTYKKLGEIVDILNGFAFKSSEYVNSGIRVIRIANVQKGAIVDDTPVFYPLSKESELKRYILREDDILMSLTGNVGRVGLLPKEMLPAALNQRVACLRLKDNAVDFKFLYRFLDSDFFEQKCIASSRGVAQLNMSTEWLKEQLIPVPSLEDQQRIVRELDAIHAILSAKNEQLRELDNLAQAVFYSMFGDPITNEKGWDVKKIGDVFDILNGFAFKSSEYVSGGIRVIRIANVQKGAIVDDAPAFYPLSYEPELKRYMLHEDDLLMSLTGNVGRVGLLPKEMLPAALNQRVACLRLKNDGAILRYLYQYFNLDYFEQRCIESSRGIAQLNMSTEWLKEEFIPLPPLDLQQAFASKITAIEQQKELIRASIAETETLLAARMQHYFD